MKKIVLIFTILFTFLGGFLFFTNLVFAQDEFGLSDIAGKAELKNSGDLPTLSGQVLGAALSLVGVVFFILMIYGGILWMMARGNSQETDKALNIILAAVIGLIIVFGSYAFTKFLFETSGGGGGSSTGGVVISGSSKTCANPIPGLAAGIDCTPGDNSDCTAIDARLKCDPSGRCRPTTNSVCVDSCGSGFSCMSQFSCDSATIQSNHCSSSQEVCCKKSQNK